MRKQIRRPSSASTPKTDQILCNILFLMTLLCFLQDHFPICEGIPVLELDSSGLGHAREMVKRVCAGKVEECLAMSGEDDPMESESSRRVLLMRRRYISYATLSRDSVPCGKPGASYYNCRNPGEANSYSRDCEVITRCARGD